MEPTIPEFGRFAEPSLLILVSLSDGPKHGYAIMTEYIASYLQRLSGPQLDRVREDLECLAAFARHGLRQLGQTEP